MSNWTKTNLEIVADIKLSNVDKKTVDGERPIRLCNYTDVYKNAFISSGTSKDFMSASCNDNEYEKFVLQKDQVALTKDSEKRDDIGISTYISDNFEDVVLGYHLALITPYSNKLNGRFLYYWLNTKGGRQYFENNASGSGQRYTLTLDILKNIPVHFPPLDEQDRVVKTLSSLENKIELNNKINTKLEQMAKTLYDYWFVQFDFPDANGKPYKSSGGKMVWSEELKKEIPKGWEVFDIRSFSNIFDSKRVPLSNQQRQLRQGIFPYYGATEVMDYIDDYIFDGEYILLAEDGSVMDKKGFPNLQYVQGKFWVNNHAHILQAKNILHNEFLFRTLQYVPVVRMMTGSVQMKINQENLMSTKVFIPSEKILKLYSNFAAPARKQIFENKCENQKLAELRDWLLPMLMNGQVTVS